MKLSERILPYIENASLSTPTGGTICIDREELWEWDELARQLEADLRNVARAAKKLNIKLEGIEPERDIDYTASWGAFRDLYEALDALPRWVLEEEA